MKRKTNLFYLSGDDSKFITFSNYGESLTGNFLATDWKLFPSKFICMYVKYLDVDNEVEFNSRKKTFIQYVASYYENKMACLRDYCIKHNKNIENELLPLNYLLEALFRITTSPDNIKEYDNITGNNENIKISFVGDISEQDYNGIYTDAINIITSSDKARGNIYIDEEQSTEVRIDYNELLTDDNEKDFLYGWWYKNPITGVGKYDGPGEYYNCKPILDIDNYYMVSSKIKGITTDKESRETEDIKFNIVIPLYDLVNINSNTNTTKIVDDEKILINEKTEEEILGFETNNTSTAYIKDVPMGIWFSEIPIELKRNKTTGYAPSWSLLLSSQFKPFPYSHKIPVEITQNSTKEAFATYSQVLIRQNKLLDNLEKLTEQINQLNKRVDVFESKLNNIGTSYTIDKVHTELMKYEKYMQNNFDLFKDEIYAYITNNWKGYIS